MTTGLGLRGPQITARTWASFGSCLPHDPELWYADGTGRAPGYNDLVEAKRICEGCPVRAWCLDSNMAIEGNKGPDGRHGIRGGLTPMERAKLARSRARQAAA